jgi:hypothetical protein
MPGSVFRCARASTATDAVLACLSVDREAIYAGFATLFCSFARRQTVLVALLASDGPLSPGEVLDRTVLVGPRRANDWNQEETL